MVAGTGIAQQQEEYTGEENTRKGIAGRYNR
jgi:hypothetical protein